jgi:hypothetical protein
MAFDMFLISSQYDRWCNNLANELNIVTDDLISLNLGFPQPHIIIHHQLQLVEVVHVFFLEW